MNFLYRLIFLFMFLALYSYSFSQPHIEWQRCLGGSYDDKAYSLQQTKDRGYIIAGSSASKDGDVTGHHGYTNEFDYWVIKLDSLFVIQLERSFGGSGGDEASSIQQTKDGGYIVSGISKSNDGDVSGHHGSLDNPDYWIAKLNLKGLIQWQISYGGSNDDEDCSIQQTYDGGYIIAGNSNSNDGDVTGHHGSNKNTDFWIVNINSIGTIQWQKSLGGSNNEQANSIQQTYDGGYIIAGTSYSNNGDVTGHHGDSSHCDFWIVKLDSKGDIQWQKSMGGSNDDFAQSIQLTNDGGYIIAGGSKSNDGDVTGHHGNSNNNDFWIVKINSIGDIQWQKSFGGSGDDIAYSIQKTIDNSYIIAGTSCSNDGDVNGHYNNYQWPDYWILKLDSSGTIQWQKIFGGSSLDYCRTIIQTNEDGYAIVGYSRSIDFDVIGNHGNYDIWIIKLSPDITDVPNNKNLTHLELSISPNPASDNISIFFPGGINQSIHIYNSLGIEIKRFEEKDLFEKNSIDVNVEGFPSGIYYVMQDIGCLPDIQCLTKSFVVIR